MSIVAAERIKLTSTKSPWWCTIAVVVLSLGVPAIIGFSSRTTLSSYNALIAAGKTPTYDPVPLTLDGALAGVSGFGVLVLMILAALSITSEYRFGIIRTTFQAIPNRTSVLFTKALLLGVFGAILTFVLALGAYFVAKAAAGPDASVLLTLDSAASWRAVYGVSIYAFLCVFLAVGVGALLRQSAAAIALLLLWPLLLENLFNLFAGFGRAVIPYLPFLNAMNFLAQAPSDKFHWGPWGSLAYFAAWVVVVFGAAVIVVKKRDA